MTDFDLTLRLRGDPRFVRAAVAAALGIPEDDVRLEVRRLQREACRICEAPFERVVGAPGRPGRGATG